MTKICYIKYPEEFNQSSVKEHSQVREELEAILEKSGYKGEFARKYRRRLKFLCEKGKDCILKSDWFESLIGAPDIYSMRITGTKNIRILFTFVDAEKRYIAILLCTFEEKKTKDYSPHIEIAQKRKMEIERAEEK